MRGARQTGHAVGAAQQHVHAEREARRVLAPPFRKTFGQRAGEGTFPADAGAGTTETGSRIKGQTGKQDGCGTVGIGGNALRESGQGRQFGNVRHQREGRLVRLFDDRTTAVETEPRCRSILPQARREPERRFAVAQGQGEIRQHGRKAVRHRLGEYGQAAKPRGTGHGVEHNAEHPLHIEYGLRKGRHQSSPRTSVKKSTRVGSTAAASSRTRRARSASSAGSSSRSRASA